MDTQSRIKELEKKIQELERDLAKARKESDDANRKKTMFLANMSHEIRTPMNSILGIYSLLNQTQLTDEQKDFLEIINIASYNLLTIINDILDLAKIEAGQLKLENKPFSLHDEIFQVIKLLSLKAKGKGIDLYSKIEATVPSWVIGDAVRLKQILINLANNAIKFTDEGEVLLAVEVINPFDPEYPEDHQYIPEGCDPAKLSRRKKILKFSVIDTGIGISQAEQETLFNDFAQLENPLIQEYEGTGLGLSISRTLTRLMDGKMGVVSEKGKGSTFWFTLILEAADPSVVNKPPEATLTKPVKIRPLQVLLVEDNLLNQKFAVTTLKREGHQVDIAENGKLALEKFRRNNYDLILMDIAMPVMDGLEAARMIREIEKEKLAKMDKKMAADYKPVKILAITAHIMVTDKDQCIDAGMNDYLAKPYRPSDLTDMIHRLGVF